VTDVTIASVFSALQGRRSGENRPLWTVDEVVDLGHVDKRDGRRPTMQARQIMTSPVLTVRADTTVREAATLLLENRITAAPVLDAGGELIGIVSEGD